MLIVAGGIVIAYLVIRVGFPLLRWLIVLLAICWVIGKITGHG